MLFTDDNIDDGTCIQAFPSEGRWISMKMPLHFYRKTDESSARQQGYRAYSNEKISF